MKKTMFIAASVLLAVGLFAFTVKKPKASQDPQQLYWYYVTHDEEGPKIEYNAFIDLLSLDDAELQGYDCEGEGRVCKAGFIVPISFSGTTPYRADTNGDENFEETDPNQ